MIRKITLSNYYSFSDTCSLDLTVNSRAPHTSSYIKTCDNRRLSKVYTVIGANASGKTSLLRALSFSCWFAKSSYQRQQSSVSDMPYKPFALNKNGEKVQKGEISLEVESNKSIYQYDFSVSQTKVLSESLKQTYPKKELIFSRYEYDQQSKYNLDNLGIPVEIIKNQIKPNASLLSLALSLPNSRVKKLNNTFDAHTNVRETGHTDPISSLGDTLKVLEHQPIHKSKILDHIQKYDIDLSDIDINSDSEGKYVSSSFGVHNIKDTKEKVKIPLIYESTGTKYLISIFRYLVDSLSNGVNAFIDEIDNNLHPLVIPQIIDLFINTQTNPHNAQLIISTHNTDLLNYLDKQQIIITEKDNRNSSFAFKLSQIRGVKETDNIVKKYLSGNYGGIPNI